MPATFLLVMATRSFLADAIALDPSARWDPNGSETPDSGLEGRRDDGEVALRPFVEHAHRDLTGLIRRPGDGETA
jgi:hypothetical protein